MGEFHGVAAIGWGNAPVSSGLAWPPPPHLKENRMSKEALVERALAMLKIATANYVEDARAGSRVDNVLGSMLSIETGSPRRERRGRRYHGLGQWLGAPAGRSLPLSPIGPRGVCAARPAVFHDPLYQPFRGSNTIN